MPPIDRSTPAGPLPRLPSPDRDRDEAHVARADQFTDLAPSFETLASEVFGTATGPPLVESLEFLTRSLFEDRIVEWGPVMKRTSLSKRTIQRLMQEGTFPRRVELSELRSGWRKSDIDRWIRTRPTSPTKFEDD